MKLPFLKISTAYQPNHVQQMGTFFGRTRNLPVEGRGRDAGRDGGELVVRGRRSFMFWRGSQGFRCSQLVSQARRL